MKIYFVDKQKYSTITDLKYVNLNHKNVMFDMWTVDSTVVLYCRFESRTQLRISQISMH